MTGQSVSRFGVAGAALVFTMGTLVPGSASADPGAPVAPGSPIDPASAVPKTIVLDVEAGKMVSVEPGLPAGVAEVPIGFIDSADWHK
ncbi:hypothetical protein ACQEVZ_07440 [Dactylosporangium sp. CA-152071]|uniref:hypothetical protein n=1 Tax=Dactylosporangium sp. CA-152071 TaxID=3239933 RepID=UPI003D8C77B5